MARLPVPIEVEQDPPKDRMRLRDRRIELERASRGLASQFDKRLRRAA